MSSEDKYNGDNIHRVETANGDPLTKTMTMSLSNEQYERLFFQPSAPRGDLRTRLGNPTLLGLLGFLIPYSSTMFILCGLRGAVPPTSLIGLNGDYYFLGAIAMNIAGVCEFILGNTFPFAVFVVYGTHWGSLAYAQDPGHNLLAGFASEGGATGAAWNSSQGFHNVTMTLVSFAFLIGSLRINVLFVLVFFGLVMLFSFIAAADFAASTATTPADAAHISKLLTIAGGFGMIGTVCGWYLVIIVVCESTGVPCPLPIFDLSTKVFPKKAEKGDKNV
ncbi:MAG: hypothetical protein M1828_006404 [Chrysothrix sp. TS-e1954]|nr:MAG: hypothetical protein M1828_006404 [Chrysothrix sp. TS-e1954]